MQTDPSTGHFQLAWSAKGHCELRLGDLLNPIMQAQGRPTREVRQVRLGRGGNQRAGLWGRRADKPRSFFSGMLIPSAASLRKAMEAAGMLTPANCAAARVVMRFCPASF